MTAFGEYAEKYPDIRMKRDGGILEIAFHTDGGSLVWGPRAHRDFGYAFADIGSDPENHVVIMTGTGADFLTTTAAVDLAPNDLAPTVEQFIGERSRARADLKNKIARTHARVIDQCLDEVVVDEKVLAERFAKAAAVGFE